ncbi:thiamine-phosphate pyrophosphorylase [Oscillibacter valericigenes Sjm18-20]|nr:thiamine-phosphate pyrophosphorylase [Oscillibacter valericigenes Sjm18-20]
MDKMFDYTLYLVTDRGLMSTEILETAVEKAIEGGVTMVQLREKEASSREFYDQSVRIKKITDRYGVPLIVNDRIDIALAIGADGVHIGQSDLPAAVARTIIGREMLLGVSASSLSEALQAQLDGADYLGVGAMFHTGTKQEAQIVSMEKLLRIRQTVRIPVVAIGGIDRGNAASFRKAKIDGLAVVSAIISQPDIKDAAEELKRLFLEGVTV